VDVLIEDPFGGSPYLVLIETLDESDLASHFTYKERQFLNQLLPVLFPSEILETQTGPCGSIVTANAVECSSIRFPAGGIPIQTLGSGVF
jgi:hypothetical protein